MARAGAVLPTLALVVFLRVAGVFLVLVGFLDHWAALGGSAATGGAAFGAYALGLALFLLPLGALSDRVGRREVMVGALVISAVGGLVAAWASEPWLFALARFVQGAGAVNGVALAVAGEVGAPERRTRRMAALGAAAGAGVVLGLLGSAGLARLAIGIPAILVAFSVATLLTVPLVWRVVPARALVPPSAPAGARRARVALPLALAGFAVNAALTGLLLFAKPLLALAAPGLAFEAALLVMVLPAGAGMYAAARLADAGRARLVGVVAAALLGLAPLAFLAPPGAVVVLAAGALFFVGHSALSSLIPSLATRDAAGRAGAVQGFVSTAQYFGSAAGAAAIGWLFAADARAGLVAAFLGAGVVVALGVVVATRRAAPQP